MFLELFILTVGENDACFANIETRRKAVEQLQLLGIEFTTRNLTIPYNAEFDGRIYRLEVNGALDYVLSESIARNYVTRSFKHVVECSLKTLTLIQ